MPADLFAPNQRHPATIRLALLFAILLIGLVLRAWPLNESLWIDELHTAWSVSGQLSDVAPRAQLGNNGPTYFWIVYALIQITGLHEWSLRALSVACGVGLVLATFLVTRSWRCTPAASLLAAALVAVDINAVYFSSEARTYALVQLVSLGHVFLFWRLLVADRRQDSLLVAWTGSAVLLFHLHCTTALALLAEIVAYGAAVAIVPERVRLRPGVLLAGLVAVVVGMAPAVGLLRELAERRENWELFVKRQPPLAMLTIYPLHTYLGIPVAILAAFWLWRLFRRDRGVVAPSGGAGPSEQGPFQGLHDTSSQRYCEDKRGGSEDTIVPLVICLAWLFVPLFTAWLLTEQDIARVFFRRYLIASSVVLAAADRAALQSSFDPVRRTEDSRMGYRGDRLVVDQPRQTCSCGLACLVA